ncbi:MAG TPA: hypothetical protein PKD90_11505, partial [Phnomibacter sp.]|nr:hypothetical protein [Phnomibacter sp.]
WGGGGGGVMPEMGAAASIYSSCNYGGIRRMLDEGNYPNLSYEQIRNVASIKLSPGYAMVLYAAPNYGGAQSGVIDADNACLGSYWQRTAKSARVYKTDESSGWQGGGGSSATGIRIFSDCNYRGASQELAPGRYNMNGQVNFTPAAFQVPPGFEVVLYNNPMLTGAQTIIRENMACLGEYWRNNTRVIVVKGSGSAIKPLSANN